MVSMTKAVTALAVLYTATLASGALSRGGLDCVVCELVVAEAVNVADNSSDVARIIAKWDGECEKIFKPNSTEAKICEEISKDVLEALPWLDKQLDDLAWDIPEGLCTVVVPACEAVCCLTDSEPEQVHISLTRNSTEMAVTWVTKKPTATSTVQWGDSGQPALPNSATGTNITYTTAGWLGQIHTAVMTGLKPGSVVQYRVGDAAGGYSKMFSFHTLPADVGTDATPLSLVHLADIGYGPASDGTVATLTSMAQSNSIHAIFATGDISYADGFQPHWDKFMRKIEPVAATVPFMVAPGNHEFYWNFTAYKHRFAMPCMSFADGMFWSLPLGPNVHLTSVNTETMFDTANVDPAQRNWLATDLVTDARWKIAGGHRPLYCSQTSDKMQCGLFAGWLRANLEDMFHDNHVDLVLAGHQHEMEHSFPLFEDQVLQRSFADAKAPVYVVNGAAGNREGNRSPEPIDWSAWGSRELGFGHIEVKDNTLAYTFLAANGTQLHQFTLDKKAAK
eukprot:m.66805 g.66805  ORF g.66805 m.66805 type:complete len:507 (+) comp13782_c0_seq3:970-2490(+)